MTRGDFVSIEIRESVLEYYMHSVPRPKPIMKCPMLTNPARHLRLGSKQAAAPQRSQFRRGGAVARASDDSEPKGFFDANPTMSEASEPITSTPPASTPPAPTPPAASSTNSLSSIDMDAMVEELSDTTELGSRGEALFVIQAVLILLVVFPAKGLSDFITTVGFFSFLAGIAIIAWSVNDLGDSLSPLAKPRENAQLVTDGAYKYTRHPMYGGLLLSCLGLGIATSNTTRVVITLALLLLLDKKATKEEGFLQEKFGDGYARYQKSVKKLIPWLY